MLPFKKVKCTCGCGRFYTQGNSVPIGYKITSLYNDTSGRILEIEREDEVRFRVGDTVQRVTETGIKRGKGVIYCIEDSTVKYPSIGMRLFVHMIGHRGTAPIENVRYENADSPNMFRFLRNITK